MGKWTMRSYNGRTNDGCDYSIPLDAMLPSILSESPKSSHDIANEAGRSYRYIVEAMSKLRKEGRCHIAKWKRGTSGPPSPVYAWGPGEDAARPRAITERAKQKKWRESAKGRATLAARSARKKIQKSGLVAVDPLMAIMMGMTK